MKICYVGKIIGGFDLSKACYNGYEVILPEPEIFSNEIIRRYTVFKQESCFNKLTKEDINFIEENGKRLQEKKVYRELTGTKSMDQINMIVNNIVNNISITANSCNHQPISYYVNTIENSVRKPEPEKRAAIPCSLGDFLKKLLCFSGSSDHKEPQKLTWGHHDDNAYNGPRRLIWGHHDDNGYSGPRRLTWDHRDDNGYNGPRSLTWDSRYSIEDDDSDRYDKYWRR